MRRTLGSLAVLAVLGCDPADGDLKVEVLDDGTVRIELVSEEGTPVRGADLYVRVRGVRTMLLYAASTAVESFCEQLPTAGPLVLRLSASLLACPEIHVAAYRHEPPEPAEGEAPPAPVPVAERCTTYQSLLSTRIWSNSACVTTADGGATDGADGAVLPDAGGDDSSAPDAPDSGVSDADADAGARGDAG